MARYNPLAFSSGPVIFFTSATYIALLAILLIVHLRVPSHPNRTPIGTNLTQAWADLEHITRRFHPYNSHSNDDVRAYLSSRIQNIVHEKKLRKSQIEVIDDRISNVTFASGHTTVYFEGTNIIIAIRGSQDDEPFYTANGTLPAKRRLDNAGVLVNAHYDSVSTGYGATDDGVGVVTVLQLLSYFTESKNWPKRTVVLLLNNGEEDFLNGAKAYMRHPISQVAHTFVNLEGAGAGGRATLFRSTDSEVTRFYRGARHPFGTVISADGFKKRLIRSETDYKVFYEELGLRGLDVAFMEPRARYHTIEDSTRETSLDSVWHMLSAAISTTAGLASVSGDEFSGPGRDDGRVDAGSGTDGVWFDLFGEIFVIFKMHTMFALCVTLLVVAPLTLIGLTVWLSKADKNYLFARRAYIHSADDDEPIRLYGWRGFSRFPIVIVVATTVVVGLAYLVVRVNPFIIYSSPFAVWSMMLSTWFAFAWFISRGADAMRPTALHRHYSLIWMFVGSFVLLAFATVLANNFQIAGGYFIMFNFAGVFLALLISYMEMFFAPSKSSYAQHFESRDEPNGNQDAGSRPLTGTTSAGRSEDRPELDDEATETTSLLRGDRRSFARHGGQRESTREEEPNDHESGSWRLDIGEAVDGEQGWSGRLPSWLWIVQFLLVAPITIVLVGQIALLLTSALYQTPSDGNSPLFTYIAFAALAMLLLAPTGPFIHRFTYHIPTFLFAICIATVIYNLVAFPFSRDHRLKVYFIQRVNLETGTHTTVLTGLDGYVQRIVEDIPSAQGQLLNCTPSQRASRKELTSCEWSGLPAKVVPVASQIGNKNNKTHTDSWVNYTIRKAKGSDNNATIRVEGQNTKACRIYFDAPISGLAIAGGVSDPRFDTVGDSGSRVLQLWHREFSQPWDVSITWDARKQPKLSGRIACLWSDANAGEIPALDELQHYLPVWAIPTKYNDGLVEGYKHFDI